MEANSTTTSDLDETISYSDNDSDSDSDATFIYEETSLESDNEQFNH